MDETTGRVLASKDMHSQRLIASIRGFKPKNEGEEIKVTSDGKFYTKTKSDGTPEINDNEQDSLEKKYSYQEANNQQKGEGISKLDKKNIKESVKKITDKVKDSGFDSLTDEEKEDLKAYQKAIQSLSTKEAEELDLSDEKDMLDNDEDWSDWNDENGDGYEDDDDEDANDETDYEDDDPDNPEQKKKLKNPAQEWKRRKKKNGTGTTTNYYNVKNKELGSISPKEYKDRMAKYKESKQKNSEQKESKSLTYSLRNNYLFEHNLRGYIKNKLK